MPCTLKFQGSPELLDKVRKHLQEILSNRKGNKESIENKIMDTPAYDTASSTTDLEIHVTCVNDCHREAPGRKESSESIVCNVEATSKLQILATASSHSTLWLQCKDITLVVNDKFTIESSERLQDQHLNFGQRLLKESFPDMHGLRLTLLQDKSHTHPVSNAVQILFVRGNHWITVHTKEKGKVVHVYDSLYSTVDPTTARTIQTTFHCSMVNIRLEPCQKQKGSVDCGLFALAYATSIVFGEDVSTR